MDAPLPDFADLEQREARLIKLNEQLATLQRALLSAPNRAEKKRLKKLCKGVVKAVAEKSKERDQGE